MRMYEILRDLREECKTLGYLDALQGLGYTKDDAIRKTCELRNISEADLLQLIKADAEIRNS